MQITGSRCLESVLGRWIWTKGRTGSVDLAFGLAQRDRLELRLRCGIHSLSAWLPIGCHDRLHSECN